MIKKNFAQEIYLPHFLKQPVQRFVHAIDFAIDHNDDNIGDNTAFVDAVSLLNF